MELCSLCHLPESMSDICGLCRAIYQPKYRHPRQYVVGRAHRTVVKAMRNGDLPPLGIKCVDCGGLATEWDHRDYNDPLRVDPVCRSCNCKRGEALSHPIENSWAAREQERAGG